MKIKTASPGQRPRSKDHSSRRNWARLLRAAMLAAGALLAPHLIRGTAGAAAVDFCRQTSQAVLRSCQAGAQSDYCLALGKCSNLADPAAREDCKRQASADLKEALQTCK